MRPLTVLAAVPLLLASALAPAVAAAAPSGSVDGSVEASKEGVRWTPPERVVGGNAFSVLLPFQIGAVSYLPKAKIGFAYDRQIEKAHWLYLNAGFLADRGNYENFRMKRCGFEEMDGDIPAGLCNNGSVMGFDVGLGYVHKFYVADNPWVVPFIRAGLGFGWWKLPSLKGGVSNRNQIRSSSWTLNVQPGGGFRIFLTGDIGIGFEVQLPLGVAVHRVIPGGGSKRLDATFLLGVATLVGLEYRF